MIRLIPMLLVHGLGWWSLSVLVPEISEPRRRRVALPLFALIGLMASLAWLVPGGVLSTTGPWKLFAAVWMVVLSMIMFVGAIVSVLAFADRRWRALRGVEGERVDQNRRALLGMMGRSVPVAAAATGVVGVASGSSGFVIKRETVRVEGLPKALHGFRIGQITDVHVGPFVDAADLRRAVEALNEAGTDLQVMTGDLIDDMTQLPETMAALSASAAKHGMWAVLGNHEHFRGVNAVLNAYREIAGSGAKVRLLVDESHQLEHEGARLRIVGVDYPMPFPIGTTKAEAMVRSAERAFREVTKDEFVLCLSHHPDFFDHANERGAHLTLSGHTHGGQVGFLGLPVFGFAFRYMVGRFHSAGRHLYVSRGTGHWVPFRVGMPAEVTVLTLEAA